MNHCQDCEHFARDGRDYGRGYGRCSQLRRSRGDDDHLPLAYPHVPAATGIPAYLIVSPKFGCIQFEVKVKHKSWRHLWQSA
jgi:hypothetical protein